jgi:epoxyqueuosine reductase
MDSRTRRLCFERASRVTLPISIAFDHPFFVQTGTERAIDFVLLKPRIRAWGAELGFAQIGVSDVELGDAEARLLDWLSSGYHGDMDWLERHRTLRSRPGELVPGTLRVISVRLDYRPAEAAESDAILADASRGYVSRYALGRDYHKVLRSRLQKLAERIEQEIGPFRYRVFSDSAPVMEVELAVKAGLGWRGKHTLLLNREGGSWFFLGEIYTDLPLPPDDAQDEHCGTCQRCIDVCPTQAIIAPYRLDARRCISYLTIEHAGGIAEELRPLIGNRVYGCDDCQLVCPWNRYAQTSGLDDFRARHGLDRARLLELFAWDAQQFERNLEGSAIRRIGHERWLRNLAIGLGNAPADAAVLGALRARSNHPSELVQEHVAWAISQQQRKLQEPDDVE